MSLHWCSGVGGDDIVSLTKYYIRWLWFGGDDLKDSVGGDDNFDGSVGGDDGFPGMALMIVIKVAMTDDSVGGDDYFDDCCSGGNDLDDSRWWWQWIIEDYD